LRTEARGGIPPISALVSGKRAIRFLPDGYVFKHRFLTPQSTWRPGAVVRLERHGAQVDVALVNGSERIAVTIIDGSPDAGVISAHLREVFTHASKGTLTPTVVENRSASRN
jgi:hypothetical protein